MSLKGGSNWVASVLVSGAIAIALPGAAQAIEIYKWVDENGVTHYSNIKPAGAKVELVPDRVSVIPGSRIGAEADRAAERERASPSRGAPQDNAIQNEVQALMQARAQRREKMLRDCERNNGVDCEREVDTELRAEGLQAGGVIRTVPPPASTTPAAPGTTSSTPSSGSSLR
jgi:hypothetical protein